MSSLEGDRALAERLADAAGQVLRRHWRQPLAVETKPDQSPVTQADREAEAAIRALLAAERPGDTVFGEELGHDADPTRGRCWVLDPIDGTKSFLAGKPLFTTLIALLIDGIPTVGVIDQPVSGERWVGATGAPSSFRGRPCRAAPTTSLAEARLGSTAPELFPGEDRPRFERLAAACRFVSWGGDAYNYGLVAAGHLELVAEAGLKLYDAAALVPVLEGAGAIVTDWAGRPVTAAEFDGRLLAAAPAVHKAALERLAS